MKRYHNEEQYETHFEEISKPIFSCWEQNKESAVFDKADKLFTCVHTVAELALKDGVQYPFLEKVIMDAIQQAYEIHMIKGEHETNLS